MKFRSPTWLRNILDFEILTGKDITGEPSRRAVRKEINRREKERKQRVLEEKRRKREQEKEEREEKERLRKATWNMRWRTKDTHTFRDFYKEVLNGGNFVFTSDLDDIKKKWRYKDSLWEAYDIYLERERKKLNDRIKQQKINDDVDDILNSILNDWSKNPYSDKIETIEYRNGIKIEYTMENGETITLYDNKLTHGNTIYTLGTITNYNFNILFNKIVGSINSGRSKKRTSHRRKKGSSDNPKRDLYNSIIETIKKREDQLKNMKINDPDRESLMNELRVAKLKAKKIKIKYSF